VVCDDEPVEHEHVMARIEVPAAVNGSWAVSPGRRRNMQANRSRDTKPELALRRLLHARGMRYRVATRPLPELRRTADIVFRRARVAVFVDGCYWHGCPEHYRVPRQHTGYWSAKIAMNVDRDRDTDVRLHEAGWKVLRFWEHEDPEGCVEIIRAELGRSMHASAES
jgi:DNA mismatch endonuclease (patch repair protein)